MPKRNRFRNGYRTRMEALKQHGARCQCCGASPADGVRLNVDHIKPRRLFPELALVLKNLQVLCAECNHGKGNWDQTDWRRPVTATAEEITRGAALSD
jgi:5-methylcytosine-specific restriction endonuclease McrA